MALYSTTRRDIKKRKSWTRREKLSNKGKGIDSEKKTRDEKQNKRETGARELHAQSSVKKKIEQV